MFTLQNISDYPIKYWHSYDHRLVYHRSLCSTKSNRGVVYHELCSPKPDLRIVLAFSIFNPLFGISLLTVYGTLALYLSVSKKTSLGTRRKQTKLWFVFTYYIFYFEYKDITILLLKNLISTTRFRLT